MKLTYFFVGLALIGATTVYLITRDSKANDLYAFQKFKRTFSVQYHNEGEESYRLSVFLENLKMIEKHNAVSTRTFDKEVNQFADLSAEEFGARYLVKSLPSQLYKNLTIINFNEIASQPIDWTTKNVLPSVKNQLQCDSSYAFSTAGLLESVYNIHNKPKTPISFSEQQLIDCCGAENFGCQGCGGGYPTDAIAYTIKFGIVQESQYLYTAKDGNCNKALEGVGYKPSKQFQVAANDAAVQAALQNQPISILVDASKWSSYARGVFPASNCSTDPQHASLAALLVGYNADGTWKVRNSWGTSWGQGGYITLAAGNTCGLENQAIYVTY